MPYPVYEYKTQTQTCTNLSQTCIPDDACAGLRKLGPKNNIPEVFLTRKAKNMNHGSPLFPTN